MTEPLSEPQPTHLVDAARRALMSRMRLVMIAVGAVAALLVVGTWLVDEGEIVKVTTVDARGRDHVTELWIVDLPSGIWLRAGSPDVEWLARIRATPEIVVERQGEQRRYRAVPDPSPEAQREVDRAMSEKYGAADRFWARVSDHAHTVPIRLEEAEARDDSP